MTRYAITHVNKDNMRVSCLEDLQLHDLAEEERKMPV